MRWLRAIIAATGALWLLSSCGTASTVLYVNPGSIRAGDDVELRATCGDNVNSAHVSSKAFGSVTLVPNHGILSDSVHIPPGTKSGQYAVNLACASGQRSTAQLAVIDGSAPDHGNGPHTGGGEMAQSASGRVALAGGLGAIGIGILLWLMAGLRRRSPSRS